MSPQSRARAYGNLALRSLAIQGSQSSGILYLLSRFSALLRLQFRGKLEPVQLTVILKPEDIIDAQPVAWQVLEIDSRDPTFEVNLPNERAFGDARIEEHHDADTSTMANIVTGPESHLARPQWLLWVKRGEGLHLNQERNRCFPKIYDRFSTPDPYFEVNDRPPIGTYNSYDEPSLQPFVLTEEVQDGANVEASHALLLQIYLTSGVKVGQLMTESLLVNPLLRPTEGINVTKIKSEKITFKVLYGDLTGISICAL